LLKWMKERITIFEFTDVHQLASEIECGILAADKRKGYCFQRSAALELVNPAISNLWKLIMQKIANLGVKMSPMPLTSRRILLFDQDSTVVQDRVFMAQDVKISGVQKKTGDIAGIRARDDKGNLWDIFIEAKNATTQSYLNKGLTNFFKHGMDRNATFEIYIYLSLLRIENPSGVSHMNKNKDKIFLVIPGLQKEDCTLDIYFLSNPQAAMTMQQLVAKLSPPDIAAQLINNDAAVVQAASDLREELRLAEQQMLAAVDPKFQQYFLEKATALRSKLYPSQNIN